MARIVTYGTQPLSAPPGTFREVHFPKLMLLDQGTIENWLSRKFSSDGMSVRNPPLTISMQFHDEPGHGSARPVGALHEVHIDGEAGLVSGKGWLADVPDAHLAEILIIAKALHQNSADLGDVPPDGLELEMEGDPWDDDFHLTAHFLKFSLVKTTFVATPAFADMHGIVPSELAAALGISIDELTDLQASCGGPEPLIVDCEPFASAHSALEMTAAMSTLAPFDYFHTPEADVPHKILVEEPDANGWVHLYGHLARWGQPHTGIHGENVYAPRSRDGYARFCQPSVLTEKGWVNTGPITLLGGHISLRDACNDPKYAWADVRVIDGRHGPWVSGVARPHVSHEAAVRYVARASRISGHWEDRNGGPLRMIVCCTAEGFPIDSPWPDGLAASFEVDNPPATGVPEGYLMIPKELLSLTKIEDDARKGILEWAQASGVPVVASSESSDDPTVDADDEFDVDAAADERERELALEAEAGLLP